MFRLVVATSSEAFERMCGPLGNRDTDVRHLRVKEFALDLSTSLAESLDVGFVYPARPMRSDVATARHDIPRMNTRRDMLTPRNKTGVVVALEHAGPPTLRNICVSNPSDGSNPPDAVESVGLDYPVVIKPNSTTRGISIAEVRDPDSLLGHANVLGPVHDFRATGDKSSLIQEWLPEARDCRAIVFDGEVIGAVKRRLSDGACDGGCWKHSVHRGAEAVGVILPRSHHELVESVADELGIHYLGVDLFESDGQVVVLETNVRPTTDDGAKYDGNFFDRLTALVEWVAKKF